MYGAKNVDQQINSAGNNVVCGNMSCTYENGSVRKWLTGAHCHTITVLITHALYLFITAGLAGHSLGSTVGLSTQK